MKEKKTETSKYGNGLNYFEKRQANAAHARKVVDWAKRHCMEEITRLVDATICIPEMPQVPDGVSRFSKCELEVIQNSTVDAIMQEYPKGHKVCALNFASYKNPGGMFIDGSMAQEESLCHASLLYPILSSEKLKVQFYAQHALRLNKALYHSDLLYTPDVPFWQKQAKSKSDIITCAAPNKRAAQKYQNVPDDICKKAMEHRIASVLYAAFEQKAETLILGAFGCGVFGNDVTEVAEIFRKQLFENFNGCFHRIVFAVLDTPSYEAMRAVFMPNT